jgi:hypothetical protein
MTRIFALIFVLSFVVLMQADAYATDAARDENVAPPSSESIENLQKTGAGLKTVKLNNLSASVKDKTVKLVFGADGKFVYTINEIRVNNILYIQLLLHPVELELTIIPEFKSAIVDSIRLQRLEGNAARILIKMKTDQFRYKFNQDLKRLTLNIESLIKDGAR